MRPFRRPPAHLPHCSRCLHRSISTTATATRKRRKDRDAQKTIDHDLQQRASILRTRIREARVARREDWILGPLAPRRETGGMEYGTVSSRELKGVKGGLARGLLTQRGLGGITAAGKRGSKGKGVGMSWKESLIYEGDRVAILSDTGPERRDKWKIGTVTSVREKEREVLVKGLNKVDLNVLADNKPAIESKLLPIPLSSVRLVHNLPDPYTRIHTDKIISRLIPLPDEKKAEIREEFKAGEIDLEEMKTRMGGRAIPGSKEVYGDWVVIPLPKARKNKKVETKEHDSDTVRFEVEEKTWTPTLLRTPMPGGVIDELRNKYSRFRTRHDAGYQLALDNRARRKAEYKAWAESGGGMLMTPAKEARQMEREKLKEKGEPTLEKELLERIGEVMAKHGVEMTGKRRRETEKNLRGERVVKWGSDVEIPGEKKAERAVLEEEEDEDDEEWEEEEDEVGDVVIEEDKTSEKRPTL
ncbi:hypothetical protein HO133_010534 [Letharia lupina]|uniref:KOW domain-containing protein n=1 Tax=Letharia lupina TaxID=560253 RepID=A0A8H6CIG0_9LECA|nr:uncharacterized protein HO133_010534 [Letharia lupina]KAF6223960.1 hypothetical protein HO133_010534 [Letharia lupina]